MNIPQIKSDIFAYHRNYLLFYRNYKLEHLYENKKHPLMQIQKYGIKGCFVIS